jgi:hypothetical protein
MASPNWNSFQPLTTGNHSLSLSLSLNWLWVVGKSGSSWFAKWNDTVGLSAVIFIFQLIESYELAVPTIGFPFMFCTGKRKLNLK